MTLKSQLKSLLPRGLMGRSLLILIIPILIVQLVTMIVFFDRHWSRVIGGLSYALAGEVAVIAERIEKDPAAVDGVRTLAIRHLDLNIDYNSNGVAAFKPFIAADFGWERIVADSLVPQLEKALGRPFTLDMRFEDKWIVVDVLLSHGVLTTSLPQRRLFSSSGYIYLLWVFGSAVILLLVAVLFMRNQIRPIYKLAAAAERFGRGHDVQFFKPQGSREVRQAGQAFLSMYESIRRQVEQRTLMLAGVSHDLRTPLTRLKLQLSMMSDHPDATQMQSDIQDMERMIEGYLDFVRGTKDEEETQDVDLHGFLDACRAQFADDAARIALDMEETALIAMRPMAMKRCITNVISNALRYADEVFISAVFDDGRALITIDDNGPGIAEDQLDLVFRPFYRVDQARSSSEGHVGLGLSIAKDIVLMHGGHMHAEGNGPRGGLRIIIDIPL